MEWKDVDWDCLAHLRDGFLSGPQGDYWKNQSTLEHYDLAFAPRIAAKWHAVWAEVGPKLPDNLRLLDWACGTGTASRTALDCLEPGKVRSVSLWDQSSLAIDFATQKRKDRIPLAEAPPSPGYWLLISHVENELGTAGKLALEQVVSQAAGVVWVEPGTPSHSQALITHRNAWSASFRWFAPCPHNGSCGLTEKGAEGDWCHQFADPFPEFFTQAHWALFSKRLKIDLRSLPVSFLAGVRNDGVTEADPSPRILGRPRVFKGFAQAVVCRETGVSRERIKPSIGQKKKEAYGQRFNHRLGPDY